MSTLSVQKILSEKATYNFQKFGKTFLTRLPNSEVPEKRILTSGVV